MISNLIDLYFDEGPVDKPDKRASSWANDRSYLNNHARPLIGKRAVSKIKPSDISKFQRDVNEGKSARKRRPGRGRDVSGGRGAASHAIRSLSAALTWAVNRELIPENPCNKIKKWHMKMGLDRGKTKALKTTI